MNTKDFISKVLPEQDNYLLFLARNKKATWNENYETVDAICDAIALHDKTPDLTVYLAVGKFANNIGTHKKTQRPYTQRLAEQATLYRALAADLDVEHGNPNKYDSQREAVGAVFSGCDTLGIPRPMIVLSGNGVHAWWPLSQDIHAVQWRRLSTMLRNAFDATGVKYDTTKISEPAMVLRPVGAHHKKDPDNWKLVSLAVDAEPSDPNDIVNALRKYDTGVPIAQAKGRATGRKKAQSAVLDALVGGDTDVVLEDMHRCKQLSAMLTSAGATDAANLPVVEPLWRASLGIAKFCEDSEAAAIALSSGHPDYDEAVCLEKLYEYKGTGPTICETFNSMCPNVCESCEHYTKITSPAQLTGGVQQVDVPMPETGEVVKLVLPNGYVAKNRCIFRLDPRTEEETFVSSYIMWIVARVCDADENTNSAKIYVEFPAEGAKIISIDSSIIAAGGNDLRKALADKQVYIKEDIDPLRNYLMTYLKKLQNNSAADISYKHFGWQNDGTFLMGDTVIGAKRETHIHLEGVAREYKEVLQPKGDPAAWKSASRLFNLPGMEFQNFATSLALGSPMMKATGIASAVVNMYSSESGTGKTLTGMFGLSAWGDPTKLVRQPKDTEAAFYKHFGTLNSFGGYMDEATTLRDDYLRTMVYTIQDGVERRRLGRAADAFRDAATWNMPVITSSNRDMYEILGAKISSQAQQLRLLQLPCPRVEFFEGDGTKHGYAFDRVLRNNYGHAGPRFIESVIASGGCDPVFERYKRKFEIDHPFDFEGPERFYQSIATVAYVGGEIGNELGLIAFDHHRGMEAVLGEIESLRTRRSHMTLDGFDTMFQYMTESQDKIVYHYTTPTNKYALQPTPRVAVARVEITLDGNENIVGGIIYINRKLYREWCALNGAQYNSTVSFIQKSGANFTDNTRVTLYKGVVGAASSGQTYCFAVDIMSHPRLIAAITGDTTAPALVGKQRLAEVPSGN